MYRFVPPRTPRIAMSVIYMLTFRIYSQTDFQNSFNDLYTHLPVACKFQLFYTKVLDIASLLKFCHFLGYAVVCHYGFDLNLFNDKRLLDACWFLESFFCGAPIQVFCPFGNVFFFFSY